MGHPLECRLERIVDFATHDVFVGEIVQTWADEAVIEGGKIDVRKVDSLLFDMAGPNYWSNGDKAGNCWSIGKSMKRKAS